MIFGLIFRKHLVWMAAFCRQRCKPLTKHLVPVLITTTGRNACSVFRSNPWRCPPQCCQVPAAEGKASIPAVPPHQQGQATHIKSYKWAGFAKAEFTFSTTQAPSFTIAVSVFCSLGQMPAETLQNHYISSPHIFCWRWSSKWYFSFTFQHTLGCTVLNGRFVLPAGSPQTSLEASGRKGAFQQSLFLFIIDCLKD